MTRGMRLRQQTAGAQIVFECRRFDALRPMLLLTSELVERQGARMGIHFGGLCSVEQESAFLSFGCDGGELRSNIGRGEARLDFSHGKSCLTLAGVEADAVRLLDDAGEIAFDSEQRVASGFAD